MFIGKTPKKSYDKIVLNHVIFMTEDQRYAISEYEDVETTGVLTQYEIKNGKYNVKHAEIICKYIVSPQHEKEIIQVLPSYYKINLPIEEGEFPITNKTVNVHDIVNKKDGGREHIFFEAIYTDEEKKIQGYHKVEIKDIKVFMNSISFLKV